MSREVMKMALDMLNEIADEVYCDQRVEEVITALQQALEKEHMTIIDKGCYERGCACYDDRVDKDGVAVVARQWVGLTDDDIEECTIAAERDHERYMHATRGQQLGQRDQLDWWIAQAIEQALREKNT